MHSEKINESAQKLSKAVARAAKQFTKETGFAPEIQLLRTNVKDKDGDVVDFKYGVQVAINSSFKPSAPI